MHQVVSVVCLPLLGQMPSQEGIFPERSLGRNHKIDPFSPHHQTTPSKSLDRGPTSPILARYKWVVLWSLCMRSTTLHICLLLLPCHFYRSYHISFCYVSLVFVLILHGMKGMGSWASTNSSYFLMGLDISLAKVPIHPIRWAFALVTSLLAMPMDSLAVIPAMLAH